MNKQQIYESDLNQLLDKNGIESAPDLIEFLYKKEPLIRNNYAKLGNIYRAKKQYKTALKYLELDRILGRINPAYRQILAFVLAKLNRNAEAKKEINRSFLEDPSLLYGYRLVDIKNGLPLIQPCNLIEKAQIIHESESTSKQLIYFSNILAQNELWERAAFFVSKAYEMDADLVDSYAYIGGILRAFAQFEKALDFYEKDNKLGRLSPEQKPIYAQLLTYAGLRDRAEKEIYSAYDANKNILDGFSMIGSFYRINGMYDTAFKYYDKDRKFGRISPAHRHILADQFMRKGQLNKALTEVEYGYRDDLTLLNGFARLGNILRAQGNIKDALNLYQRDKENNFLTLSHHCIYIELLLDSNEYEKAISEINEVIASDSKFQNSRLLPSWLCKISQKFAKNGQVEIAIRICDHFYKSYPNDYDIYSRIALIIKKLSPLLAKKYFKKDWKLSRQSNLLTSDYIKFLLDRKYITEAKLVWTKIQKDNKENFLSNKIPLDLQKIKHHIKRLQPEKHTFKLPAIIISFPRSGSNFLQNVLSESSGYESNSLDLPIGRFYPAQNLTVKSHAIDFNQLQYELQVSKISFPPPKVIILFRDPRDVMRSLLEFTNSKKKQSISPDFFLSDCSYNYAAEITNRSIGRSSHKMSVSAAYRKFVTCWVDKKKWSNTETLTVFYEDLCLNTSDSFNRIFDFLNIKCSLNNDSVRKKVALYSNESNRTRGVAYGWRKEGLNSHDLYGLVNNKLDDCIKILGYNEAIKG